MATARHAAGDGATVRNVGVFLAYILAGNGGTILYDDDLKVGIGLTSETVKQFVNLVRPIIYWYYNALFHIFIRKT